MAMMNEPASRGREPFSVLHGRFRDTLRPCDWDELSAESADDGRKIRFVYERLYAAAAAAANVGEDVQTIDGERNAKNGDEALEMKKRGNECFQKSDYPNALNWYSLAAIGCPQSTKDWLVQLSIIYANRSACLYHLGDYDRAITDIRLALDNGYPKDLRYKVHDRKARCFLATKQLKSAQESFRAAVRFLDDSNLSADKRRERLQDVRATLDTLAKNCGNNASNGAEPVDTAGADVSSTSEPLQSGLQKTRKRPDETPKLYGEPNPAYPAISDVVSFAYNKTEGRHAVAEKEVPAGKILLIERAYASVLLREYCHSHCTNCFVKLIAPLPCPNCDRVAFCGEPCRKIALKSYHAIECPLLPAILEAGVSITCLIAFRIITQRPLQYFVRLKPKLRHTTETPVRKREPEDYVNLYNLVTHRRSRCTQDVVHRTHLAAFFLRCLKTQTNYFGRETGADGRLSDDELFIGGLLLHHLMLVQFNAFEVSELGHQYHRPENDDDDDGGEERQTVFIGGSVYPTLALLNHSCNPCVVRYHRGTTVVLHNIRDLRAGEEITENYGPMFTLHPKEERQQTLKTRYWFECNCIACSQDWPTWEQMNINTSLRIRCKNCQNAITVPTDSMEFVVRCKVCSKNTNLFAALKVLQDTETKYAIAKRLMDKRDYEKALSEFIALLSLLHRHLVPPFRDYHLCQQAIRRCMLSFGNK